MCVRGVIYLIQLHRIYVFNEPSCAAHTSHVSHAGHAFMKIQRKHDITHKLLQIQYVYCITHIYCRYNYSEEILCPPHNNNYYRFRITCVARRYWVEEFFSTQNPIISE